MGHRLNGRGYACLIAGFFLLHVGCEIEPTSPIVIELPTDTGASFDPPPIPDGVDPAVVAQLSVRVESDHFIFYYEPGDSVWPARQDAYHRWAVEYLDVSVASKITYFKFADADNMYAAIGQRGGGRAFPADLTIVTVYSWHPHEAFHIYNGHLCPTMTIRLYEEGMAVAHEFDPFNDNWESQWNRRDLDEPYVYSERILEHRSAGRLYQIEELLESEDFNERNQLERTTSGSRLVYDEAGMFVAFLIDRFGLDAMKEAYCSVLYEDSLDTIKLQFEEVFGMSVGEANEEWLAFLDASM